MTNDPRTTVESPGTALRASSPASPQVAGAAPGLEPGAGAISSGTLPALRAWIVAHDDSKLFLVLYVGLAVVLSIWISLFWLVAVVAVHFGFELIRQARYHAGTGRIVSEALWEVKLDIALILFALVLTLYMELVFGIAGLAGAARVGAASRAAARFAGWERTLRGLLLSVDDAAQVVRATTLRRRKAAAASELSAAGPGEGRAGRGKPLARWGSWSEPYTTGTWIALGLGAACMLLIVAAPWLTPHTAASALQALAADLRPLP